MLLTIELHQKVQRLTGINLRVFIDGVDITDKCSDADDEQDWALVYKLNEEGKKYLNLNHQPEPEPAMEILTGNVRYVRKAEEMEI